MFCKHCGAELPDSAKFCPSCGHTLTDVDPHTKTSPTTETSDAGENSIHCPECGSRDLQYVTDTDFSTTVKTKGYSGSKGCLGTLMLGPFGLLCGSCGSGKSTTTVNTTTSHGWICKNCGHKFRDKSELEKEIREMDAEIAKFLRLEKIFSKKNSIIVGIALMIFGLSEPLYFVMIGFDSSTWLFWLSVFLTLATPFLAYWCCSALRKAFSHTIGLFKRDIDDLKKQIARFDKTK